MAFLKSIWTLLKRTFSQFIDDKAPHLGAAIAYYTIFAIAPLLVIIIAIAGLIFGADAAQGKIVSEIGGVIGTQNAETVQMLLEKFNRPSQGIIATIIGIVTIIIGAGGVFSELQDDINIVWGVDSKPGAGVWQTIRRRLVSFSMILVIGFLLLVSLVVSAGLSALGKFIGEALPLPEEVLQAINFIISLGVVALLFAMLFKFLPDVRIRWGDVWIGSIVTALLFTIGKFLIGLYLGKSSVGSAYGAAGSLVILLVWVYYSAQIFLFGAEFTQVYANRFGAKILPARNARFVNPNKRPADSPVEAPSGDGEEQKRSASR